MTNEELNKRMHEIIGLCYPDREPKSIICRQHGMVHPKYDFTSDWSAFGLLWSWMQEHEKWDAFIYQLPSMKEGDYGVVDDISYPLIQTYYVNPLNLSTAIVEFFKEEEAK